MIVVFLMIIDGTKIDMNIFLKTVLYECLKFEYEYDFGSTTYLNIQVVDYEKAITSDETIK